MSLIGYQIPHAPAATTGFQQRNGSRPPFRHPGLIELGDAAVREACGGVSHRLPSGPLHDAAEVCRAGVPTVMLFVQSLRGISHNKIEDTREDHLDASVRALDALARRATAWIAASQP